MSNFNYPNSGLKNRKSLVRILLKQYAMGQGLPCANFLNKASRNFSCHILKTYRFVEITTSSSEMYISDVHVYAVGEPLGILLTFMLVFFFQILYNALSQHATNFSIIYNIIIKKTIIKMKVK